MAADSTSFEAALKEVWTQQTLEDQLYQGNPLLEGIERMKPAVQVGDTALTPIHTQRSGGYSAVPRTGTSSLNSADEQEVNQASYNYTHHWFQVEIDTAIVDESSNNSLAVAQVVETEVSGALNDMRKQLTRQAFMNGDALIAECDTTSAATEVELEPTDFGYDAIVRGWLYPGLTVDIGTAGNEVSVAADRTITAVEESATTPSITISGGNVNTAANDFVSIANARVGSTSTSHEMNGLRNIVSQSEDLGGLSVSSVPTWKAAEEDNTAQDISLELLYDQERAVFQKCGMSPDWQLTGAEQYKNIENLLQAQARFEQGTSLRGGHEDGLRVNSVLLQRQPDCPDKLLFTLYRKHLFVLRTQKPNWISQKYGGSILEWKQSSTRLVGGLVYRIQLAANRRNCFASLTNLNVQ